MITFIRDVLRRIKNRLRSYYHKLKLDREFKYFLSSGEKGIVETSRSPKIILSLTSYPPRIPRIHYVILTLLRQTLKPDMVILWLAKEQFPNGNNDLPSKLLTMQDYGLTIRYTHDIKSYKKLIPAISEFLDDIIVTTDDDVLYDPEMLERLYRSYEKNPGCVHGHRGHRITVEADGELKKYVDWGMEAGSGSKFMNFLTGIGGILYPPHHLHDDVIDERIFMEIAPSADDIWFWAMAVLKGTKACIVLDNILPASNPLVDYEKIIGIGALWTINGPGGQNDIQLNRVLERYPIIEEKLKQELKESNA